MVKLHNTMTRTVEELRPLHDKIVTLYTCGPTVYGYPHLGNWATYIRWDILVRTLQLSGYVPEWVMNITDVGHLTSDADEGADKLEKEAKQQGRTAWEIGNFYTKDFIQGLHHLNITEPTRLVKATDHIKEQIRLVTKLEAHGFTYQINDGIYFDTSKLPDYGKLARLKINELRAGARVTINEEKRHPTDFALWKFSPQDSKRDMEWPSPWGVGFPGWHIECSAMAMHYLGETLDIHAGGIDHIPVHHTNEIAQSEAVTGKPFANIWLHSNFITIDGVKLSKSLKNSFTLQDIAERGYEPLALRLLFMQSHYRSEANFTWESLQAAKLRLENLRAMADLRWQPIPAHTQKMPADFTYIRQTLLEALQDDLNTPRALAELGKLERHLAEHLLGEEQLADFEAFLDFADAALGLDLHNSQDINPDQKTLILNREAARQAKDFAVSDTIRTTLAQQGIRLRDTPHSPIWSRILA